MRITPLDIQQKQFPMKFRGFDVEEVYAFLEVIREEMEDLRRDNASLKEDMIKLETQVKEHKDMETTLRETLVTAQQMVEEYKSNARKEAELLVKEAELFGVRPPSREVLPPFVQQEGEEYKSNARKEAELLVKEAELRADAIVKDAQEKVIKIHEDIVDLKGIRRHFKEELKRLIEGHLKMLEFAKEREEEGRGVAGG